MAVRKREPLTNEEGDVRELTAEDFAWFVKNADFGTIEAVHDFLDRREEILETAETFGIDRDFFLAFDPNKPGFEDRVTEILGSIIKAAKHAAE